MVPTTWLLLSPVALLDLLPLDLSFFCEVIKHGDGGMKKSVGLPGTLLPLLDLDALR